MIPVDDKDLEIVEGRFNQDQSNMAECFEGQPCLSKSFEFIDDGDIEKEIYVLIKQALEAGYNIKNRILLTIHGKASCFMKTSLAGKLFLEIEKEDGQDAN